MTSACDACGNAVGECECPDRADAKATAYTMLLVTLRAWAKTPRDAPRIVLGDRERALRLAYARWAAL